MKNKLVRKYAMKYLVYWLAALWGFPSVIIIFVSIVSFMINDDMTSGILAFYILGLFFYIPFLLIQFYKIKSFVRMIQKQEIMHNITFNDNNLICLPKTRGFQEPNYISDEWIIISGKIAIYYKEIVSLNQKGSIFSFILTRKYIFELMDGSSCSFIGDIKYYDTLKKWIKEKNKDRIKW